MQKPTYTVFSYLCTPFQLKEALHSISSAYPNYQHHYFCALGLSLLNKISVTGTQALKYHGNPSDNQDSYQVNEGREHVQPGDAGQGDDPCPGSDEVGLKRYCCTTQNAEQFKTYKLFISGFFNLILSDHGGPQVTGTIKSKTMVRRNTAYEIKPDSSKFYENKN